jgi:predicted nuclease of predicted toxin-antitoxin system
VWLLDANIDVRVCELLAELGIQSRSAESLGWKRLSNGRLVAAAVAGGFSCLLTRDQLFHESAARTLILFPEFAIIVLQLPQGKRSRYLAQFREAWEREPIIPARGRAIRWPRNAE